MTSQIALLQQQGVTLHRAQQPLQPPQAQSNRQTPQPVQQQQPSLNQSQLQHLQTNLNLVAQGQRRKSLQEQLLLQEAAAMSTQLFTDYVNLPPPPPYPGKSSANAKNGLVADSGNQRLELFVCSKTI